MVVFPAITIATPYVLRARFLWNEPAYEAVAAGIRSGAQEVVHFLAVSHGYAVHVGYARAFSRAASGPRRRFKPAGW